MKGTVLVVDDKPIIRDPIAATLDAAGYQALRACNGEQALETLRTQRVDLILLDVDMPVMGGLPCLRAIRGDSSMADIPVIMLSGAEDRDDVLQAAKLGIRGYVLKSQFSLKDLLSRVTQHFDGLTTVAPSTGSEKRIPNESPNGHSPDMTKAAIKPTQASLLRFKAMSPTGELPSLLNRKQCVERAKQVLHGRTLSGVVAEVISLAASPRGSTADLTAMIARDPLLSARVLQVANSSVNASTRGIVATLADAVRNIGCAAVRNIAATLGIFNAIPASDSEGFNLLRCWQHAFAVATLCNHLAPEDDSGLAYLVGLCHDLGEILFHSHFAEECQQVLDIQQLTGMPRDEVEKKVLGMSHGEILQVIVQCLELPNPITSPILEYQLKGPGSFGGSPLTRLLRLADIYANGMLLASSNQSPIRPITCAEANSVTGKDNPPRIDRVTMRSEILALTATLSRFTDKQQAEVMVTPFPEQPVRVWLARDPSLSSLDPLEAALAFQTNVITRNCLPSTGEAAEYEAIVVMTRNTSASGFTWAALKKALARPDREPVPALWLVGRVDGELGGIIPYLWPISLAKLAEFVAGIRPAQ
jgi:HD-like signal output (HDOD) protein/CheY-like chemotaxis protein